MSKKILALGKNFENEINEEEKYVEEIIEHSINDANVPEIENEIKGEENDVEENMEPSINDDNVPVKIKFTGVRNEKRAKKLAHMFLKTQKAKKPLAAIQQSFLDKSIPIGVILCPKLFCSFFSFYPC